MSIIFQRDDLKSSLFLFPFYFFSGKFTQRNLPRIRLPWTETPKVVKVYSVCGVHGYLHGNNQYAYEPSPDNKLSIKPRLNVYRRHAESHCDTWHIYCLWWHDVFKVDAKFINILSSFVSLSNFSFFSLSTTHRYRR